RIGERISEQRLQNNAGYCERRAATCSDNRTAEAIAPDNPFIDGFERISGIPHTIGYGFRNHIERYCRFAYRRSEPQGKKKQDKRKGQEEHAGAGPSLLFEACCRCPRRHLFRSEAAISAASVSMPSITRSDV